MPELPVMQQQHQQWAGAVRPPGLRAAQSPGQQDVIPRAALPPLGIQSLQRLGKLDSPSMFSRQVRHLSEGWDEWAHVWPECKHDSRK